MQSLLESTPTRNAAGIRDKVRHQVARLSCFAGATALPSGETVAALNLQSVADAWTQSAQAICETAAEAMHQPARCAKTTLQLWLRPTAAGPCHAGPGQQSRHVGQAATWLTPSTSKCPQCRGWQRGRRVRQTALARLLTSAPPKGSQFVLHGQRPWARWAHRLGLQLGASSPPQTGPCVQMHPCGRP